MTREEFDAGLGTLTRQIQGMGQQVLEAIHLAVESFIERDTDKALSVIQSDGLINASDLQIEKEAIRLLALQSPYATDLRVIVTSMKIASDLERMGDHAASIAKTSIRMKGNPLMDEASDILLEMAEVIKGMLKESLDALEDVSMTDAKRIAAIDDRVDELFQQANEMTLKAMKGNPSMVYNGSGFISACSNLERIGDYVTNICERIVYIDSGSVVEFQ
ncbi:phosphate transport system regulatory protein PhoU [Atopobacter sp. AH10]|uniref:phosphate signaling complex protein PhoU n=1 Tax=Atopobacter sp. AH10 TaxID=2315861 RepID=UPI000EF2865F|nr:phosphate signaling complex protein PhoU [Atopobacter sp. AH10]RLK63079.1 phosphate transport system regulatory protein PhoU [Atopobacter sp. AH10]